MRLFAATLFVVGCVGATKFEKCTTFGNDLCFKTVLDEVVVQMDKDGTNDDVFMEICSDRDISQCCKSHKALKSTFSDDWSSNDEEEWGVKYFKGCKNVVFNIERGLRVTLSKSSKGSSDDSLGVKSIVVNTRSPDKKDKEVESFICPPFALSKRTTLSQTQFCKTGPYHFARVNEAVVVVGNDGTDDDVKIKICSDVNIDKCCTKKLSHTFSDDWNRGSVEKWPAGQFGSCGKHLYKIRNAPIVSIFKNGKDSLKVDKFSISFNEIDIPPRTHTYSCGGFELVGNCKKNPAVCTSTFTNCKKRSSNAGTGGSGSFTTRPTRRPTNRPTLSTNRPSFATTTTKKSGGLLSGIFG